MALSVSSKTNSFSQKSTLTSLFSSLSEMWMNCWLFWATLTCVFCFLLFSLTAMANLNAASLRHSSLTSFLLSLAGLLTFVSHSSCGLNHGIRLTIILFQAFTFSGSDFASSFSGSDFASSFSGSDFASSFSSSDFASSFGAVLSTQIWNYSINILQCYIVIAITELQNHYVSNICA